MGILSILANILWILFGGGLMALIWFAVGLVAFATVVGIPFGVACWRIGVFTLLPFGHELVDTRLLGRRRLVGTRLANIVWVVFFGWWLALAHLIAAAVDLLSCVLIFPIFLGAPLWALANARLAVVALVPLGSRVVTRDRADDARRTIPRPLIGPPRTGPDVLPA